MPPPPVEAPFHETSAAIATGRVVVTAQARRSARIAGTSSETEPGRYSVAGRHMRPGYWRTTAALLGQFYRLHSSPGLSWYP